MQKATLEEMATACQDYADMERVSCEVHYKNGGQPDPAGERKAFALESAATLIRALAIDEDRSRQFIGKLLEQAR